MKRTASKNQALVDGVITPLFAEQKKATPDSELPWHGCLAKEPWIVPIPGTTKLERLEENLGASDVELTQAEVTALENALSKVRIEGARYSEFHQSLVGR